MHNIKAVGIINIKGACPNFSRDFQNEILCFAWRIITPGEGSTHIFGRTGMCRSNGLLFYKKSLTWVLFFTKKILKHGSTFLTERWAQIFGLSHGKNPENQEIFVKWAYFSRKNLKNGYPFLSKSPLKMGRGFGARAAHPCPTQIWDPPPPRVTAAIEISNFSEIAQTVFMGKATYFLTTTVAYTFHN